jgi:hypothetical protein
MATFKVKLVASIAMKEQLRFAIRKGGKIGGAGVVTKRSMALAEKTPALRGVILFHAPAYGEGHFNNQQKRNRMKKFLVLYRMDMAEMQKMMASTSAEERRVWGSGRCG